MLTHLALIGALLFPLTTFNHTGEVDRVILLQISSDPGPCGDGTIGAIVISELSDGRERWVQCASPILCQCRLLDEGELTHFEGTVEGGYDPESGQDVLVFLASEMKVIEPLHSHPVPQLQGEPPL